MVPKIWCVLKNVQLFGPPCTFRRTDDGDAGRRLGQVVADYQVVDAERQQRRYGCSKQKVSAFIASKLESGERQEAETSPRDRATRRVS